MAISNDKRLTDLEQATGSKDETKISVNWHTDGLILDEDTGERVTEEEWRKRHPDDRLIIVGWDDDDLGGE